MKLDNFPQLEYLDYCLHCDIYNVSVEASFSHHQLFHIALGSAQKNFEEKPLFYLRR